VACAALVRAARATGAEAFALRHLLQGLVWVAMVAPVVRLGRRLAGPRGAWFAGLALLGQPVLLGHAFNNPKDAPLACAAAWLLLASSWAGDARRLGWRHALGVGAALGFVLAVRPGAWFLVALPGLALLARWARARPRGWRALEAELVTAAWCAAVAVALAWLCMLALWPHAHASPLVHPIRASLFARRFDEVYPVLFAGVVYPSDALPRGYLATFLLLTVPLPIGLLGACGHAALGGRALRRRRAPAALAGLLFTLWFPVAFFVAARPTVYDGMRHFLFVLPPLAVLAGVGAAWAARALAPRLGRLAPLPPALLLLGALPAMVQLHPYESSYFNLLAGDPATLHERYELDYWVSCHREAALWLDARQRESARPLSVVVVGHEYSLPTLSAYLDPRVKVRPLPWWSKEAALPADVDYWVATVRWGQWRRFPERPLVHRVERGGALFCVIRGPAPR
jgi:hypothetical protein